MTRRGVRPGLSANSSAMSSSKPNAALRIRSSGRMYTLEHLVAVAEHQLFERVRVGVEDPVLGG
ncbi:MAG TPA: hypothetical protein VHN14_06475 [Kofleriaceae bacterium]|nr:hypothetical protein [Kofleriaceae bacterium]